MFKKLLLATTVFSFLIVGTAVADNFYAGVEAGLSSVDLNLKGKKADDTDLGPVVGAFVGYNKDLPVGIWKDRGNDSVRVEGLFNWRMYDYSKSFHGNKVGVSADVDTFSFMPSVYYDLKSLHLYKNDEKKTSVYPYVGAGVGFAYHSVNDTKGHVGPYKFSVSNGDNVDMAWHAGAGLAADLPSNWVVNVGWRFTNLGEASTGDTLHVGNFAGKIKEEHTDVTAHEVVLRVSKKF